MDGGALAALQLLGAAACRQCLLTLVLLRATGAVQGAVRLERALPDSAAAASSGSSGSSGGGGGSPTAMTGNAATTGLQRLAELLPAVNGSGTLLCLVDSGVALSSSLYGCSGGVNSPRGGCRVVVGHDLVGDQFSGESGGAPRASGPNPVRRHCCLMLWAGHAWC